MLVLLTPINTLHKNKHIETKAPYYTLLDRPTFLSCLHAFLTFGRTTLDTTRSKKVACMNEDKMFPAPTISRYNLQKRKQHLLKIKMTTADVSVIGTLEEDTLTWKSKSS